MHQIFIAIRDNNIAGLKKIIETNQYGNLNHPRIDDHICRYPLLAAMRASNLEMVELLLKNGANPNLEPLEAVGYAVSKGNLEMLKLLVKYNANVNSVDALGYPVIYHAANNLRHDIVEFLINKGAKTDDRFQERLDRNLFLFDEQIDNLKISISEQFFKIPRIYRMFNIKRGTAYDKYIQLKDELTSLEERRWLECRNQKRLPDIIERAAKNRQESGVETVTNIEELSEYQTQETPIVFSKGVAGEPITAPSVKSVSMERVERVSPRQFRM